MHAHPQAPRPCRFGGVGLKSGFTISTEAFWRFRSLCYIIWCFYYIHSSPRPSVERLCASCAWSYTLHIVLHDCHLYLYFFEWHSGLWLQLYFFVSLSCQTSYFKCMMPDSPSTLHSRIVEHDHHIHGMQRRTSTFADLDRFTVRLMCRRS